MLPAEQRSLPMSLPSLAGTFCSPGAWSSCSACTAEPSCSALELRSTGGWQFPPLGCWLQLAWVANRQRQSSDQSNRLCFLVGTSFHRNICCRSRESSVGFFQDLVFSTAGFYCRTPASVPAPLTWKQESILRKCLAWCCSQQPQH